MPTTSRAQSAQSDLSQELQDLLLLGVLTWTQVQLLASSGAFQIMDRHIGGRGLVYQLEPANHSFDQPIWRQVNPGCWKR